MPKLILKLKLNSVGRTNTSLQGTPTNVDMRIQTDDITEINGKPVAPGESTHAGFLLPCSRAANTFGRS